MYQGTEFKTSELKLATLSAEPFMNSLGYFSFTQLNWKKALNF